MNGKRKLIVPVVAIMMCAVALAGVAYAYSTTITTPGDDPVDDYLVIDLYTTAQVAIDAPISSTNNAVGVKTSTVITGGNDPAKTVTASFERIGNGIVYKGAFKVEAPNNTAPLTEDTTTTKYSIDTTGFSGAFTIGNLPQGIAQTTAAAATVTFGGVYTDAACTQAAGDKLDIGAFYYYSVVINVTNAGAYTSTTLTPAAVAGGLVGVTSITFNLSFEATPVAATP